MRDNEAERAVIKRALKETKPPLRSILVRYGTRELEACLSLKQKGVMREVPFFGSPERYYRLFQVKEEVKT